MRVNISCSKSPFGYTTFFLWLLYFAMYYIHPYLGDDLWYRSAIPAEVSLGSFFDAWGKSIVEHFRVDNARLGNIIATPIMILPKWIEALFLSACATLTPVLTARLAGVWNKNLALYVLLIFLCAYVLPWHDAMFTLIFAINYVPAGVLMLWCFLLMTSDKHHSLCMAIIAALLTGFWHEAFGAAVVGAALCSMLFCRQMRTLRTCLLAAGAAVGMIFLVVIVPGMHRYGLLQNFDLLEALRYNRWYNLLIITVLIITTCAAIFKRFGKDISMSALTCLFGAMLASWLIWTLNLTVRSVWPVLLCSFVMLAMSLRVLLCKTDSRWLRIGSLIVAAMIFIQMAATLPYFDDLRHSAQTTEAQWRACPNAEFYFTDAPLPSEVPLYTLGRPSMGEAYCEYQPFARCVPQRLRSFKPADSSEVGCGSTAWLYQGCIVLPGDADSNICHATVWFGDKPRYVSGHAVPFEANGGRYVFFMIYHCFFASHFGSITAISI